MARSKKPSKRRASGTGALFHSAARDVWVGRAVVGKRPDGSPHVVERSHKSQARVIELLKAIEPPGPTVTVKEFAVRWLADMRVRDRTAGNRKNSVEKHIVPVLGGVKVAELSAGQIEQAARKWADAPLHVNSVRNVLADLGTMLAEAVRFGVRSDNPARAARKPKAIRKKIDPFSLAELHAIIATGATLTRGRVVSLLAGTGMRVGEALALDVADFDPVAKTLSITKTSNLKRQVGPPKSANGNRVIVVPDNCLPILRAAIGGRKTGALFVTSSGGRMFHDGVGRAFDVVQKRLQLRRRNPHQLRHSWASLAIAAGVPIADVAKWLGDTVQTIVNTYLHPVGVDVGSVMNRVFSGAEVGAVDTTLPK